MRGAFTLYVNQAAGSARMPCLHDHSIVLPIGAECLSHQLSCAGTVIINLGSNRSPAKFPCQYAPPFDFPPSDTCASDRPTASQCDRLSAGNRPAAGIAVDTLGGDVPHQCAQLNPWALLSLQSVLGRWLQDHCECPSWSTEPRRPAQCGNAICARPPAFHARRGMSPNRAHVWRYRCCVDERVSAGRTEMFPGRPGASGYSSFATPRSKNNSQQYFRGRPWKQLRGPGFR